MSQYEPVQDPELPRFFGGAVGYLGYDAVAQFERVPLCEKDGLDWPDMIFAITGHDHHIRSGPAYHQGGRKRFR